MKVLPRTALHAAALSVLLTGAAAAQSVEPLFRRPIFLSDAEGGEIRSQGDFNNDGIVDLLHTSGLFDWSAMRVLLGDGAGGFSAQPQVTFTGPFGFEFAEIDPPVGDFDGDGNADAVISVGQLITVSEGIDIYPGDGAGGFGAPSFLDFGRGVLRLRSGNIDGDPADEILVDYVDLAFDRFLVWVDWNGSAFVPLTPWQVDPIGVHFEAIGDFDGDGEDEIAATAGDYTQIRILETSGGVITPLASWPVPPEMHDINHRIRAGDVEGDGDVDLVHLQMNSGQPGPRIQVYENQPAGLVQHPFQLVATPELGWVQPHQLHLADWNGDGWLDLFLNSLSLDVLRSNGDYTFSEGFENPSSGHRPGAGGLDANGDGLEDFVAGSVLHLSDGSFDAPDEEPGLTPLASFPFTPFLAGRIPVDREGDGDVDFVGGESGEAHTNDASGTFTPISTGALPDAGPAGYQWGEAAAVGDFDGDQRLDLLMPLEFDFGTSVGFVEMHLLSDDGMGGYTDSGLAGLPLVEIDPPVTEFWRAADADGDGDADVLADGGYWENQGGFFDPFVPAYAGRGWDAADLNGDNQPEILVTRDLGFQTEIVLILSTPGGPIEVSLATQAGDLEVAFRDLDLDGDADALAADPTQAGLVILENTGGGLVARPTLPVLVPNLDLVGVDDADGDGTQDLYVQRVVTSVSFPVYLLSVYRGTGGLQYTPLIEHVIGNQADTVDGFADVDGDGDLDAIGDLLFRSIAVPAPEGGTVQQFGQGFAGSGGYAPVVGAAGPVTSTQAGELRIVNGLGAGQVWLVWGNLQVDLAGLPLPGMTLYVGDPKIIPAIPLGGAPGVPGSGSASLTLPTQATLFGVSFVHQAFGLDLGSPTGWSGSNGLEIVYGL